jgi:exopolyphosphatase / guanosine-5'-triphosphate,3'-diphosphate pyrophosphatase
MTVAVLDLGTNTFHLLIVQQEDQGTTILHKSKAAVKLGEGGITTGAIAEVPFRRGVMTIKRFQEIMRNHSPEKVVALGTAAIRSASNSDAFLKSIETEAGIHVQIIDGMKEAELIYLGVKQAIDMGSEKSLIMDIGGGSVEFIIADKEQLYWKYSFELGAALLLEKFCPSDPLTQEELSAIQQHLENTLQPLMKLLHFFIPLL